MTTAIDQRTALYRFFDADGRLLYVGITHQPTTRFSQHAKNKALTWWPDVARKEIVWLNSRELAAEAEIVAIKTEKPQHNLSHVRAGKLVSASGARTLSREDYNSDDWITATETARRVMSEGLARKMSRQRVMQLAESDPAWPLPRSEWRTIANMWLFPWTPVREFFVTRTVRQGQRSDLESGSQTRGHKLLAAAREAFGDGSFTRADLRGISTLSEPGVAWNVKALLAQGLIVEVGKRATAGRGLPHTLYAITPPSE